jgi:hypothetical protein
VTPAGIALRAAALALFGLGCAALGAWWRGAPAPAAAPPAPVARLSSDDVAALRRALAEDVRRGIAAALPAGSASTPAPAPAGAEPAPAEAPAAPPRSPAAAKEARRIVDEAVARGSWRPEDADAFRATMPDLDPAELSQILGELTRAINTGKLHLAVRDRPFL